MKILLTGASGFVGNHIARALQAAGHDLIPATRASGYDFNRLHSTQDWLAHLRGVDAVVNSVGIIVEAGTQTFDSLHYRAPVALFSACMQAGVRRVIQISALGAEASASTAYHRSKWAADEQLRAMPLEWLVLRPSLIYGPGGRSLRFFRQLALWPVLPLLAGGSQPIQPVHINDLVAAVVQGLQADTLRCSIDVVGARPVTLAAWLQHIRRANDKSSGLSVVVPFRLALYAAYVGKYFSPMLHPDNLRMLQQGNTAEVEPFARFLGRMPCAIEDCNQETFR